MHFGILYHTILRIIVENYNCRIKDILCMYVLFKLNETITMEEMSDCEYSFLEALGRDKVKKT